MQKSDEPIHLSIGTEISAKFKGAFCEAKVKQINKLVKCKIAYQAPPHSIASVDSNQLKDCPEVLQLHTTIQVYVLVIYDSGRACYSFFSVTPDMSAPDRPGSKKFVPATLLAAKDQSTYTVVFNDGDERVLRRTQICLKSGKHFHTNLDAMPLTNPELFGTPVAGEATGKKCSPSTSSSKRAHNIDSDASSIASADDASSKMLDNDSESTMTDDAAGNNEPGTATESIVTPHDYGRAICVYDDSGCAQEDTDTDQGVLIGNQRVKPKWYPGIVAHPTALENNRLSKERNVLVRSFRDAKFYTVAAKQCKPFVVWRAKAFLSKVSPSYKPVLEKALDYVENNNLPSHWSRAALLGKLANTSGDDTDGSNSDSDFSQEERDVFVAQLYKYQDERGTPINRAPVLGGRDLNLHRLYQVVHKLGGFSRVNNQGQWRDVIVKLKLDGAPGANTTTMRNCYSRYLLHFDQFYRQLGWRMTTDTSGGRRSTQRVFRQTPGSSKHTLQTPGLQKPRERSDSGSLCNAKKGIKLTDEGVTTSKALTPKRELSQDHDTPPLPTVSVQSYGEYECGNSARALYTSGAFKRWYTAKILHIECTINDNGQKELSRFFIHYHGWKSRFDEWVLPDKIQPSDETHDLSDKGKSKMHKIEKNIGPKSHEKSATPCSEVGDCSSTKRARTQSRSSNTPDRAKPTTVTNNKKDSDLSQNQPRKSTRNRQTCDKDKLVDEISDNEEEQETELTESHPFKDSIKKGNRQRTMSESEHPPAPVIDRPASVALTHIVDTKTNNSSLVTPPSKSTMTSRNRSEPTSLGAADAEENQIMVRRSESRSSSRVSTSTERGGSSSKKEKGSRVTRSATAKDSTLIRKWSKGNVLKLEDDGDNDNEQTVEEESINLRRDSAEMDIDADDFKAPSRNELNSEELKDNLDETIDEELTNDSDEIDLDSQKQSRIEEEMSNLNEEELLMEAEGSKADDDETLSIRSSNTPPSASRSGPKRRRRRQASSTGWPCERKTPRKESNDTNDKESNVSSARDTLNALKARIQSEMSPTDYETVLSDFDLAVVSEDLSDNERFSAMETQLGEIKDNYHDVKSELLRLEQHWKRTQERKRQRERRLSEVEGNGTKTSSSCTP